MKHKHADMIIAKANNMDLVAFIKTNDDGVWRLSLPHGSLPSFRKDNEHFLCQPQHKGACWHWLNGGDVDVFDHCDTDEWSSIAKDYRWEELHPLMIKVSDIRIKPRKEVRWIAYNKINGNVYGAYKSLVDCETCWPALPAYEIEVEV